RSIRENQLGATAVNGRMGGSRFYSANATLAYVAWGRPLLPTELTLPPPPPQPGLLEVLNGQFRSAVTALANVDKAKDPANAETLAKISAEAKELGSILAKLADAIDAIPAATASQAAVKKAISTMADNLDDMQTGAGIIATKPQTTIIALLVNTQSH